MNHTVVIEADDFGAAWVNLLAELASTGEVVSPRGKTTREHRAVTLTVFDGRANILVDAQRRPNYRFMVAEWLWIWFGRDDVQTISRFNPNIAQFSDDGRYFRGAYGPRIRQQWLRVQNLLDIDPFTREAVIALYNENDLRAATKDIPCTEDVQFFIREGRLETLVTMRSSDIWLGLVYDFFNFSMLGNIMASAQNVEQGSVTFQLGSSHLYETNLEQAIKVLEIGQPSTLRSPRLPVAPERHLDAALQDPVEWSKLTLHTQAPWMHYGGVLTSSDSTGALRYLTEIANV